MGHWGVDMDRDMGRDMEAPSFPFLPSTEMALQLEPGRGKTRSASSPQAANSSVPR